MGYRLATTRGASLKCTKNAPYQVTGFAGVGVACLGFAKLALHPRLWLHVVRLNCLNVKRRGTKVVAPLPKNWV